MFHFFSRGASGQTQRRHPAAKLLKARGRLFSGIVIQPRYWAIALTHCGWTENPKTTSCFSDLFAKVLGHICAPPLHKPQCCGYVKKKRVETFAARTLSRFSMMALNRWVRKVDKYLDWRVGGWSCWMDEWNSAQLLLSFECKQNTQQCVGKCKKLSPY